MLNVRVYKNYHSTTKERDGPQLSLKGTTPLTNMGDQTQVDLREITTSQLWVVWDWGRKVGLGPWGERLDSREPVMSYTEYKRPFTKQQKEVNWDENVNGEEMEESLT